jgi:anti-anti-sigma factor
MDPDVITRGHQDWGRIMMLIKAKSLGETTVLECAGRLVAGDEAAALKRSALALSAVAVLIVDLSRVDKIDGAGLGTLAFLQSWSRSAGIRLRIADPSPRVRKLLELTKLTAVLDICTGHEVQQDSSAIGGRVPTCVANAFLMLPA